VFLENFELIVDSFFNFFCMMQAIDLNPSLFFVITIIDSDQSLFSFYSIQTGIFIEYILDLIVYVFS